MVEVLKVDVEHFEMNSADDLVASESPNVQIVDFYDGVVFTPDFLDKKG